MATYDNERSGQQGVPSAKEYICIFCTHGFWVYPKDNYSDNIPVQTVMCEMCRASLKGAIGLFNGFNTM